MRHGRSVCRFFCKKRKKKWPFTELSLVYHTVRSIIFGSTTFDKRGEENREQGQISSRFCSVHKSGFWFGLRDGMPPTSSGKTITDLVFSGGSASSHQDILCYQDIWVGTTCFSLPFFWFVRACDAFGGCASNQLANTFPCRGCIHSKWRLITGLIEKPNYQGVLGLFPVDSSRHRATRVCNSSADLGSLTLSRLLPRRSEDKSLKWRHLLHLLRGIFFHYLLLNPTIYR